MRSDDLVIQFKWWNSLCCEHRGDTALKPLVQKGLLAAGIVPSAQRVVQRPANFAVIAAE